MDPYLRHRSALASVLDPQLYTIEWLDVETWSGRLKQWGNDDAIILVEVKRYPTGAREIHGMIAAGDLGAIKALIVEAEDWARTQGIEFASISSREGWGRVLPDYSPHQVTIRKAL